MAPKAGYVPQWSCEKMGLLLTALQTIKQQYMFQYFLKVVSTQFQTLDGKTVRRKTRRMAWSSH